MTPTLLYCEFCDTDIASMRVDEPIKVDGRVQTPKAAGQSLIMQLWEHLAECPDIKGGPVVIAISHPQGDDDDKLADMGGL